MKKTVLMLLLGIGIASMAFADDYDEIKELIELAGKDRGEITYLSKINLGILGGENWFAIREGHIWIYTVDNKNVRTVHGIDMIEQSEITYWGKNGKEALEFDIMQNIPGTQIGNLAAKFGDYNGDGLDEIFFIEWGNWECCGILTWASDTGEITFYLYSRINIKSAKGPPPIEFINYQGVDGIKIYLKDTMNVKDIWEFWVWNEESKKYVKLASSEKEETDNSQITPITPKTDNEINEEQSMPVPQKENARKPQFALKIVIISSVIAFAVIIGFFAVYMARKKG